MDTDVEHASEKSSDGKPAGEGTPPSNAELLRMLVRLKLKIIGNYVLDGLAPLVAVIAVIVAVMAVNGNKSSQAQLSESAARIESMNENLQASKGEIDKLKAIMAQGKALQDEERKKQDVQLTQVIQNVSKLQVKMKISPTLEEQMHQPAAAAAIPLAAASAIVNPVKTSSVPATAALVTGFDKKSDDRMQVLQESIKKFNKK